MNYYRNALSYAYKLNQKLYRDICHDAYLKWYNKTGTDLFEQHEGVVIKTIKNTWYTNYISPSRVMIKGEKVFKQYVPFVTGDHYDEDHLVKKVTLSNDITPEDEYIANELHDRIVDYADISQTVGNNMIDPTLYLTIYKYALAGWSQTQIALFIEKSPAFVYNYFKKMRYMASLLN